MTNVIAGRMGGGRTDGDRYSHFCVMIIVIAGLLTNTLTYAFAAPFGRKVRQNHPLGDFFPENARMLCIRWNTFSAEMTLATSMTGRSLTGSPKGEPPR